MANPCNIKDIKIPSKSSKLAEFIGIVLGDGNIHAYIKGKKTRTYMIRIAGNSIKDFNYLTEYVKPLGEDLFGIKGQIFKSKNCNCLYLTFHGKKIIDFFQKMNLPPGNKIKNKIRIPSWIFSKKIYMRACLRGLYDTDGSIYELLPNWPGLYQLNLDNYNYDLLKQVRDMLIFLGFKPSKIHGNKTPEGTKIDITRKKDIKKFYKEIGTNNDSKRKKFLELFDSPFV